MIIVLLAGVLTALAVLLSVRHIKEHLTHYKVPEFQLHIVRILAIVPIYSLTSWLALIVKDERGTMVLEVIRDSYEAYVIYNFVVLLINYGGGHLHLCRYLEDQPRMEHPFPGNLWLPPLKLGPAFMAGIRVSVLQFVFVKPINSMVKLYLVFHKDGTSLQVATLAVIMVVNNISISAALYGLVLFYHAAEPVLRPYNPLAKFICVKLVVFFSFWQGIVLSLAVGLGLIRDVPGFSASEQATGLQDVMICFEMAIAATAHMFVFSYSEYDAMHGRREVDDGKPTEELKRRSVPSAKNPLLDVVDFRDVLSDAKDRFHCGISVGYERELNDGAPLIPGNVLGDSTLSPTASSSRTYDSIAQPPHVRTQSVSSKASLTRQAGMSTNVRIEKNKIVDASIPNLSRDLIQSPWVLQAPTTPPTRREWGSQQ